MIIKVITIILYIGIITQTFALNDATLEFIEMLSTNPFVIFTIAPFVIGAVIVIIVAIAIHGGKLTADCFKSDEESWEQKALREIEEEGEI